VHGSEVNLLPGAVSKIGVVDEAWRRAKERGIGKFDVIEIGS